MRTFRVIYVLLLMNGLMLTRFAYSVPVETVERLRLDCVAQLGGLSEVQWKLVSIDQDTESEEPVVIEAEERTGDAVRKAD